MLQYIIKLSISLSVVYLFYQLLLRRLTFYTLNRWYLLVYSLLCFVIPFINVFTIVTEPALQQSTFISYIPAIEHIAEPAPKAAVASPSFSWMQVIIAVIVTGMLLMMARLVIQYYSLFKMRSKAVLLYDDKVKLYHINEQVIPFSFGRSIYVNQHQHTGDELKEIIRHEFIHVKQRHSLDMIWSELLCIINWYNPFAWLLRNSMRQNLEFIADQQVLQTGLDRKQYQYLLLRVIGVNSFSIATNFNFSSLKKRIAMMNKAKSAKVHLIRFLFILPLLVVVLLAFRNTTQQKKPPVLQPVVTDTVPLKAISAEDIRSIYIIKTKGQQSVTITLKNGEVRRYNLEDSAQKAAFESKYGSLPEPPKPPVPPVAATAPKEMDAPAPLAPPAPDNVVEPLAPVAPDVPVAPPVPAAPLRTAVDDLYKKGYCVTIADNSGKGVRQYTITDVNRNNNKKYNAVSREIPNAPLVPVLKIKQGFPSPKPAVSAYFPKEGVTITATKIVQTDPEVIITATEPAVGNPDAVATVKSVPAFSVQGAAAQQPAVTVTTVASPQYRESGNVVMAQGYSSSAGAEPAVTASPGRVEGDFNPQGLQNEEDLATIGKNTTREDLQQIAANLKEKGYTLEIEKAQYKDGLLAAISFKIYDQNGQKGAFSSNRMDKGWITISRYKNKNGNAGFLIQGRAYE